MEEWKEIEGYPNYEVSIYGEVYSKKKGDVLEPQNNTHGYYVVTLYDNNIPKMHTVHRLVAKAFIPNPFNKNEINHINGNKKDNRVSNLEWCTSSENKKHAFKNGLAKHHGGSPRIKVRVIETGKEYNSILECANDINGNIGHIASILRGEKKYKSHHGLHFERIN